MIVMRRQDFLILFLFLITSFALRGQEVSVTSAFDTSRIFIGDQINFSVTIDQPSGLKLSIPILRDSLIRKIEILSGPLIDTAEIDADKIRITEKYLITSFDSGFYMIDPIYAEIADSGGVKRFYSDYSILEVARVKLTPPDTSTRIFDIVAPQRAPLTLGEILPWVLIAFLSAVVVWLILRLIKKFKKTKKEIIEPDITEPAHVIAFRELEKLREEKLWQAGEIKKYYTRLTEIIRQYLENRFKIYSLELTTSETLEALVRSGFRKNESYNKLKTILTAADLVKFAKYKPEPIENDTTFTASWDFVTVTKEAEHIEEKIDATETQGGKSV
jgi:hypothetical protein